ncbi:MAG: glycoside hydrolase family 32 protein [Anaerolineae bacterium]
MTMDNPAIRQAMTSVEAAAARAAADPTRPGYHLLPPAHWMNDPNGPIYHDGYFHVFYQHNPYGDTWGDMHWGHARSVDLVRWEHLPIALWPSTELGEAHCFSGCARINGQGEPMLFYTSVGIESDGQRRPNEQWAALGSPDWITWRKHPNNPILSLSSHDGPPFEGDWRDPYIFEADGRTFLVLGANLGHEATVALYEATDPGLTQWAYRGLLYREPRDRMPFCECPNFFQVDGTWVLLISPYRPVEYVTGEFAPDTLQFIPQRRGVLDHGQDDEPHFYATNTVYDPSGRCILLGWVRGFPSGRGWNGCMALPRVISVDSDGAPRQHPLPELASLRREPVSLPGISASSTVKKVADVNGDMLEIATTIRLGTARSAGLCLRCSEAGDPGITVSYDGNSLTVRGNRVPVPPGREIRLHIFLDRSVVEVFADEGRVAITQLVDARPDDTGVMFFATDGTAEAVPLDAWRMEPIW